VRETEQIKSETPEILYSSQNITSVIKSTRIRLAGHIARREEMGNGYRALVVRPEVKRPLGRRRCRREDNIKMSVK
jgi:hypothetical protein